MAEIEVKQSGMQSFASANISRSVRHFRNSAPRSHQEDNDQIDSSEWDKIADLGVGTLIVAIEDNDPRICKIIRATEPSRVILSIDTVDIEVQFSSGEKQVLNNLGCHQLGVKFRTPTKREARNWKEPVFAK